MRLASSSTCSTTAVGYGAVIGRVRPTFQLGLCRTRPPGNTRRMPDILCVVEIPKGSRNKYEWSPDHNLFLLDRFLSSSVVFPADYGFIPETEAKDGDPLDVLIAVSEPTFTGCGVVARPVAVLWLMDRGEREP